MNKEKETMADEQTVQPQEVENGTENKTVRKSISWGRILIATLFILLAGGVSGAIWSYYYITKMFTFTKKAVPELVSPEPIISSQARRPYPYPYPENRARAIHNETKEGCIDER